MITIPLCRAWVSPDRSTALRRSSTTTKGLISTSPGTSTTRPHQEECIQCARQKAATQGWIDVGAAAGFDATRVAADIAAPGTQPLDCKTFR